MMKMGRMMGCAAMAAFAAPTLAAAESCPAERAVYELRVPDEADVWQITLVPARNHASIASDLYLRLTTPQRAYWFTFSVSQGYSGISVLPVTEPYHADGPQDLLGPPFGSNEEGVNDPDILNALRFLAFDSDLNVALEPPVAGEDAPAFLMLPEIGRALWYDAAALSGDAAADRDPVPRGVFRFAACSAQPPMPAHP